MSILGMSYTELGVTYIGSVSYCDGNKQQKIFIHQSRLCTRVWHITDFLTPGWHNNQLWLIHVLVFIGILDHTVQDRMISEIILTWIESEQWSYLQPTIIASHGRNITAIFRSHVGRPMCRNIDTMSSQDYKPQSKSTFSKCSLFPLFQDGWFPQEISWMTEWGSIPSVIWRGRGQSIFRHTSLLQKSSAKVLLDT